MVRVTDERDEQQRLDEVVLPLDKGVDDAQQHDRDAGEAQPGLEPVLEGIPG